MELKRSLTMLALVSLLSGCSLMPWGSAESAIDHSVFEGSAESLEVPANVSSVGWSWEAPEETGVVEVRPFPLGAVVTVSDEVIALRGDTGEELWCYRRIGEEVADANVTSSGDRVALAYPSGAGEDPATRIRTAVEPRHIGLDEVVLTVSQVDREAQTVEGVQRMKRFMMSLL
jgi:hypothetical protein